MWAYSEQEAEIGPRENYFFQAGSKTFNLAPNVSIYVSGRSGISITQLVSEEIWISYPSFLHDRPWISPWIKSISNELDITCHVFASQSSGHCDAIADRLWRHQRNGMRASETRGLWVKILVLASFVDSLCRVRNKIVYILLWRTVCALTRVLIWCLFPSLLRNSGNKHQNNPLVSA